MYNSFKLNGLIENKTLFGYDKYKNGGIGSFENCLNTDIIFLCLPTVYNEKLQTAMNKSFDPIPPVISKDQLTLGSVA